MSTQQGEIKLPGEYEVNGKKVIVDEDGFLQNPEAWDEKVAEWIAINLAGVKQLTERHWKLIKYLRNYWATYGVCPPMRMVTKQNNETLESIYELFPDGPAMGACKVAGAAKPTGCV